MELLSRAGARVLSHHLRTIAIPKWSDTPELRRALALLGYGSYTVVHQGANDLSQLLNNKERQALWELYDDAEEAIDDH